MLTNKTFQIDLKTIALILLLLFVGYNQFLKPKDVSTTVTETQTVDIKKVIQEAVNYQMQLQQPTQQPTIIYQDRIVPFNNIADVPKKDLDKVKNLNKYKDTTFLENGKIYTEILSDGTVYSNKVIAEMEEKTITNTKETNTVIKESGLFISPTVQFNPIGFKAIGAQLNYIRKNDVGLGVGAFIDTQSGQLNYQLSIHKKIF